MGDTETLKVLREILNWTRVGFYKSTKDLLTELLDSDKKRLAYQAFDGYKTIETIKTELKMGKSTAVDLFKRCESIGLIGLQNGRRSRLFDLEDFDLLPRTGESL